MSEEYTYDMISYGISIGCYEDKYYAAPKPFGFWKGSFVKIFGEKISSKDDCHVIIAYRYKGVTYIVKEKFEDKLDRARKVMEEQITKDLFTV